MIELIGVGFQYDGAPTPVLRDVHLQLPPGELVLVIGPTGAGKSTLLGLLNGLVPHFSGGTLSGRVTVDGRDTAHHPPREFAAAVGVVGQDPLAGFVTDTVEEELAYGMEQLGVAPAVMRRRVEETLDLLGIAELRDRALVSLSGGQQQRVAIGAVLAAGARILVLDEPTSALDPLSAEEVVAAMVRLVHDLGFTVLLAEHRLERVLQHADRVVLVRGDGTVADGAPETMIAESPVQPPLVKLARSAGWESVPLSVRDARRRAPELRRRLPSRSLEQQSVATAAALSTTPPVLAATTVSVRYGTFEAVRRIDVRLAGGQVAVLMGRNGSGKSSLLWALADQARRTTGTVTVSATPARDRPVALVPQTAADLLYLNSVGAECAAADRATSRPGDCRALLDRLTPDVPADRHPRDLSEGQRLALALAVQLVGEPAVLLLDEPTRGLDYATKDRLVAFLREFVSTGRAVLLATHDVEFAAEVAGRVLVMATGEIVADGPAAAVLADSPVFSPQVARVLHPDPWLTVDQVREALHADRG